MKKYVNFVAPRTFAEKEMDLAYQATAAYQWQEGVAGEKHRVFLMSCDLLHESGGPAWARATEWKEELGAHCCKFMLSKRTHADLPVFSDGRPRARREALEQNTPDARNQSELWVTFQATTRLGRRVAWSSDNKEVSIVSFPVPRVQIPVQPRASTGGAVAGESTTHGATYSGVAPMPWTSMALLSAENKGKILGVSPAKPRVQLFDTAFGQPLFWAERKNVGYWKDLLQDLNAGMVGDCTPFEEKLKATDPEMTVRGRWQRRTMRRRI